MLLSYNDPDLKDDNVIEEYIICNVYSVVKLCEERFHLLETNIWFDQVVGSSTPNNWMPSGNTCWRVTY